MGVAVLCAMVFYEYIYTHIYKKKWACVYVHANDMLWLTKFVFSCGGYVTPSPSKRRRR